MSTAARSYLCQSVAVINNPIPAPAAAAERDSVVGDRTSTTMTTTTTKVMLPKLLDWYRRDFGLSTQEVLLRVAALLRDDQHNGDGRYDDCSNREKLVREAAKLPESDWEIAYLNYRWAQPEHL